MGVQYTDHSERQIRINVPNDMGCDDQSGYIHAETRNDELRRNVYCTQRQTPSDAKTADRNA